ncbi:unnamed protein product [Closterium sp. NIES-53]
MWGVWGSVRCPYVIRTSDRAGQTCGKLHSQHRCYSRLDDARCAKFGDEAERPRWAELLRSGVDIFALDYDAILAAMYALSVSAEGVCYPCVPANPGIEAAALRASESDLPGTVPAEALHTFTLDSGASHRFFCDSTTLTPLPAHVPLRLADPSGGAVLARSSTILPCPAVPSGSLSGLHLPSFSTNLVSTAALQVAMVTTTTLGGQRVLICTCTRTGRHLATFTRRPRSSLYTLTTEPPQVATSTQVSASGLCLPSRPRLTLPCLPCVKGRQRAAPHSSFPPATAPLQTLQMDVWGPARISGQDRENYFLMVVEDYMRYTTVFLLRSKGEVPDVLILWIRTVRLQLCERFHEDLPVLRLHSDRGVPHWLSHGGGSYLYDPCGCSLFYVVVCGPVRCASAQPLAPCLFVGDLAYTALDEEGWRCFYHLTSRRFLPSWDVTFDESVPFYRVSQVDPLPLAEPVEVTKDSGAARGAASGGSEPASAEPGGAEPASADPEGAEPEGADPGGADSEGAESGGAEPGGAEPQGAEPWGAESEGAESSRADGTDPKSDLVHAASPTVPRLLATVITDPSFESAAVYALVAELVDFATACCLDFAASLVAESESDCLPSIGGECALGTDVLEDKQEDFVCLEATVPHLVAMLHPPEGDPDAPDIPIPRSYAEAIMDP